MAPPSDSSPAPPGAPPDAPPGTVPHAAQHAAHTPEPHHTPPRVRSICVFCGSSPGVSQQYLDAARDVGALLARHGLTLVYGGARRGLMGAVADAALADGGRVVGVIPHGLFAREVAHTGLSELLVVDTMHERKALLGERADAYLMLPGGAGTLEEFFEAWTWAQLGIHDKPCGVLNVDGYFDPLLAMLDHMVQERFVPPAHRQIIVVDDRPARLLARLEAYEPPGVTRWLTRAET